jgi:hypothetical protein
MVARTQVPRPGGASRNSTLPLLRTGASSSDSQAMRRPGCSSVMRLVKTISVPAGPAMVQRERLASICSTARTLSMKRARFRKSRQKA